MAQHLILRKAGAADARVSRQPHAADDPHARRGRDPHFLHVEGRARRHRGGEAARRRRQRDAGNDRDGAQAPGSRQAAARPVRPVDGGTGHARSRDVDVDGPPGFRGNRHPAGTHAPGRDHGDDHRRAGGDPAGDDIRALQGFVDRLHGAPGDHRRACRAQFLARHAHHPCAALLVQLAAADNVHAHLCRSGRQHQPAESGRPSRSATAIRPSSREWCVPRSSR